jgi:hypothetical protein
VKIKGDFVTNSSSTSFIVYIPDNFNIDEFFHLIDGWDYIEDDAEMTKEELRMNIKKLEEVGSIDEWHNLGFWLLPDLLHELELIITHWETGSLGGKLININSKPLKEGVEVIKSGGWGIKHGGWGK